MLLIFSTKSQLCHELQDPHYNTIVINTDIVWERHYGSNERHGPTSTAAVRNVSQAERYLSAKAYIMGQSLVKCSLQTGLVLTTFCFHFAWHFVWHILDRHAPQICARKTTNSSTQKIQITQWRVILEHPKNILKQSLTRWDMGVFGGRAELFVQLGGHLMAPLAAQIQNRKAVKYKLTGQKCTPQETYN